MLRSCSDREPLSVGNLGDLQCQKVVQAGVLGNQARWIVGSCEITQPYFLANRIHSSKLFNNRHMYVVENFGGSSIILDLGLIGDLG